MTYRCFSLLDRRGHWRYWRFAPDTDVAGLIKDAAIRGLVLFASVQTFAPPLNMTGGLGWKQVSEQYRGENPLPHLAPLYFDIDCEGNLEKALLWARALVEYFISLGLPASAVRVWFSGSKGAHVLVDLIALGIQPSPTLTTDIKAVAMGVVKHLTAFGSPDLTIDSVVYSLPRMLRLADQLNPKSGLFKVELSHAELMGCSTEQIVELARRPRGPLWLPGDLPAEAIPVAAAWWAEQLAKARQPREFRRKTAEVAGLKVRPDGYAVDELISKTMPTCIRNMLTSTVGSGSRNRCELQIACWSRAAKLPMGQALGLLTKWTVRNRPELSGGNAERKAESIVRSVYGNASYGFSCGAAGQAARLASVEVDCGGCRVVRPPCLRQVFSLRVRQDDEWKAPVRVSLEEARAHLDQAIDNLFAAVSDECGDAGHGRGRQRKNSRRPASSGSTRRPGRLRRAHA